MEAIGVLGGCVSRVGVDKILIDSSVVEQAGDAMSADAPWNPSAFLVDPLAALAWTKF